MQIFEISINLVCMQFKRDLTLNKIHDGSIQTIPDEKTNPINRLSLFIFVGLCLQTFIDL